MLDDEEDPLLASLRAGGERALAETIEVERPRLERIIALRMDPKVSGRLDPADVIQETFLEARKRLGRYLESPKVPVFVWLRGLTLETLIQGHRRHLTAQRRDVGHEVSIEAVGSNASSVAALTRSMIDRDDTPGVKLQREERSKLIASALERLDETDREVLTLRHFEQLGNDEVARIIGVKKAAASRRYTRALGRLREVLQNVPNLESF